MNLTPAEEFESELGKACLKWILDNNPANTEAFRNQIRQIQADALRAVEFELTVHADDPSKAFAIIHRIANQLHPLLETKGGDSAAS